MVRSVAGNPDPLAQRIWIRYPDLTAVISADLPLAADNPVLDADLRLPDDDVGRICRIRIPIRNWRRGCRMDQCRTKEQSSHDPEGDTEAIVMISAAIVAVTVATIIVMVSAPVSAPGKCRCRADDTQNQR